MHLRVFTAFSGYDSQCMALDKLHERDFFFSYELVGWSEVDRNAIKAHNAVYPQWAERNFDDIRKIDWNEVPDFDLFTYSSPCQDFSQAGKQAGGTEGSGTRSSLLWECRRAIIAKKPKYLIMENVAALVSSKFIRLFNKWQLELESYGYRNFAKVLNAKDYEVPQNRERIFMVSVLDENARYEFPKKMPLPLRLKDVLEKEVAERYYLSEKKVKSFAEHCERKQAEGCGFKFEPTDGNGVAKALSCLAGNRQTDNFIKEPMVQIVGNLQPENLWGESVRQQNQVVGTDGISPAITAEHARHEFKIAEPTVLGWSRDAKGEVVDRHPVEVANAITAAKRDNTQNYVVEPMIYDDYNGKLREDQDTCGTLTTNCGNDAPRNGFKIIEPQVIELPIDKKHQQDAVQHEDGISRCLVVGCHGNSDNFTRTAVSTKQGYRIRKLTERECFRLMDVPEEYIDRIQASGISRSQQYKLAGNSIVVSVLYHIFDKLFLNTEITEPTLF